MKLLNPTLIVVFAFNIISSSQELMSGEAGFAAHKLLIQYIARFAHTAWSRLCDLSLKLKGRELEQEREQEWEWKTATVHFHHVINFVFKRNNKSTASRDACLSLVP